MDIKDMLAADKASAVDRKQQIREDFPECTAMADMVRDAFGTGVKARYFSENGKTMGKPMETGNMDAFKFLGLIDMSNNYKMGKKGWKWR